MIPTTPNGTRTWRTCTPLALLQPRTTSPTGSGSAARSRKPSTMPAIRSGLSRSRSINAVLVPLASARDTSCSLASKIAVSALVRASAIASKAASLVALVALLNVSAAVRAF